MKIRWRCHEGGMLTRQLTTSDCNLREYWQLGYQARDEEGKRRKRCCGYHDFSRLNRGDIANTAMSREHIPEQRGF